MKTSNKLALAAVLLIVVAMICYDFVLRASYLDGGYKDPFRDFTTLNFKNFDSIDLSASTAANIIVEQGPFRVRIQPRGDRFVKVRQQGGTLHIGAGFPANFENSWEYYVMVISCPKLRSFNADATYMAGNTQVIDTIASADFKWRPTIIRNFKLDSLSITEKHASYIILANNTIGYLRAIIGISDGSASNLTIQKDNRFETCDLNILNKSRLQLQEAGIHNLKYQLADSAKLILTGAAKYIVAKQIQNPAIK